MKPPSIHRRPQRPDHPITQSPRHLLIAATIGLLLLSSLGIPHSSFAAESPLVIPFQGQVTNQQNQIVADGQYSLIFNLYDVAVGGQPLWTERHTKVGVVNGMVNLFLGSITAMSGVDFSQTRYLGITVDVDDKPTTADPEMVPRQMIIPAFHAKTAENATKLAGHDWTAILVFGNNPATGKILADKIEPEAVSATQLATNSVDSDEIVSGAVTTDEIADGTVTETDLSNALNDRLNLGLIPPGTIVPFAGPVANIPAGWLLCDGRAVDKDADSGKYGVLHSAIGAAWGDGSTGVGASPGVTEFNLPDLRGMFLRGVAGSLDTDPDKDSSVNAGVDGKRYAAVAGGNQGNLVGSLQNGAFQSHLHGVGINGGDSGTSSQGGGNTRFTHWRSDIYGGGAQKKSDLSGGSETRPVNAYVNYIIKY